MTDAGKQQLALESLKTLNNAITTTKLYPPSFPQVAGSVEKANESIRNYLRKYGELGFSLVDDEPRLCGLPVSQKTLGKTHGEDIFQQLRLLKITHIVLQPGMSRQEFQQVLVFFTTSPQLINKEGGAPAFIAGLKLSRFFPEEYVVNLPPEREDIFGSIFEQYKKENISAEIFIDNLAEEIDAETIAGQKRITSLTKALLGSENQSLLILAAFASVLRGMVRSGSIFFPKKFSTILMNIDRVIEKEQRQKLATAVAVDSVASLDEFALLVLILQYFPGGFGGELYRQLVSAMATKMDGVVNLMRHEMELVASQSGEKSEHYRKIAQSYERLFETDKGKQFLAREKAKKILEAGEKERQTKRVQAGINLLLKGDTNSLRNKEVIKHLPRTVSSLIDNGKDQLAASIIEKITTELRKGNPANHNELSESFSLIGDSLVKKEKWEWLEKLAVPLMAWVKAEDRDDHVFKNIIEILQNIQKHFWKNGKEDKADLILQLFFAIRTGKLKKNPKTVEMVGKIQDHSVEKAPLPRLLAESLTEENDLSDRRLIMQGPMVARFLLNALFSSGTTPERMKIMELLSRMGPLLPPLLLEKLAEPMPWHGKRNLIKMLTETGGKDDLDQIFDYLNHDDVRVQNEAFSCIYKLSGDNRKDNLLLALTQVSGHMREQVIKALTPLADNEVAAAVATMLEDWEHFSDEIRDSLLLSILNLLGRTDSQEGADTVERFLQNEGKAKGRNIDVSIWHAAKTCLHRIKALQRQGRQKEIEESAGRSEKPTDNNKTEEKPVTSNQDNTPKRTSFAEEKFIERLLDRGEGDKAKKMLVELIYQAADIKRFNEAEKLREWLIEIDPTALSDIIRTAELIEEQKSASINSDYLQIWSNLYDSLTTEEFNELYFSMSHKSFIEEQTLVDQGAQQPQIFFINRGKVKLYFRSKESEVYIKSIGPGELFGAETFFDASVWTVSATTLSKSEISILPHRNSINWKTDYPALESKLQDFCRGFDNLGEFKEKMSSDRREHKRHTLTGRVSAILLENDEKDSGVQMSGELADISSGGLSFTLRISQKRNARVLLGRKVRVALSSTTSPGQLFSVNGVFMTVRSLYSVNNEYSAHLMFSNHLTGAELRGVIEAAEIHKEK